MNNPQNIMKGEAVYVRNQGGRWDRLVVEAIEWRGDAMVAVFNGGWSYIALGGDGIRREPPAGEGDVV